MSKKEASGVPVPEENELEQEAQDEPAAPEPVREPDSYEFDLVLAEKPVKFKQKDGTYLNYTLRELCGPDRDKFMNTMNSNVRTDPATNKPVGLRSYEGVESTLILMSYFDEKGVAMTMKTLATFPGRVQAALFQAALKISGLDKDAEETAKKP